jgi:hypothetical protein
MSACQGKERFLTFGLADAVSKRSRNAHAGVKLHPYRCGDCGGWHIGSTIGRGKTRNGYLRVVEDAA